MIYPLYPIASSSASVQASGLHLGHAHVLQSGRPAPLFLGPNPRRYTPPMPSLERLPQCGSPPQFLHKPRGPLPFNTLLVFPFSNAKSKYFAILHPYTCSAIALRSLNLGGLDALDVVKTILIANCLNPVYVTLSLFTYSTSPPAPVMLAAGIL